MTDYCSGGDLYEYLKSKKRRIDEDLVIEWLVQLALALEFLHAKKVCTHAHTYMSSQDTGVEDSAHTPSYVYQAKLTRHCVVLCCAIHFMYMHRWPSAILRRLCTGT